MHAPGDRPGAVTDDGAVVETRGLTKHYGDTRALDGIDLTVPRGSILGLIGPSGCGKTTLVRNLIGITRPTAGEARVLGVDPARFTLDHRERFGYMPQLPVMFPNLTAWGNLSFMASVYGLPVRRRRHLMQLLDLVDLAPHRRKRLSQLSGGMQRRLTLAATLVHDPELLFLDEPTAGVDPILRERFWRHFRDLRDQGRTIIVPTQYVGEAVSCDLVAVMAAGRLVTVEPPERLARTAFGGDPVSVPLDHGWLSGRQVDGVAALRGVRSVRRSDDGLIVVLDDAARDVERLSTHLATEGIAAGAITVHEPSYDDVFVELIERADRERQAEQDAEAAR